MVGVAGVRNSTDKDVRDRRIKTSTSKERSWNRSKGSIKSEVDSCRLSWDQKGMLERMYAV